MDSGSVIGCQIYHIYNPIGVDCEVDISATKTRHLFQMFRSALFGHCGLATKSQISTLLIRRVTSPEAVTPHLYAEWYKAVDTIYFRAQVRGMPVSPTQGVSE